MLKRFYVDNYKTHINTTYELRPLNLLIGMKPGKTTLPSNAISWAPPAHWPYPRRPFSRP
jgi:hypothetical protein